ncbi:MAG TPA: gamma-glutamyl-gamma-aminobutyrate hydrolase family protein [Rhodocyclaceae bacterium]|nr:gamma-glutamyl-gamma-aminobutyrate hydrolase family protein [Rhodocyclaceae bacterium]
MDSKKTFKPTASAKKAPIILLPACNRAMPDGGEYHTIAQKYVRAARLAGGLPLVVPFATPEEIDDLLDLADGILLTGSPSNVHPSHFNQDVLDPTLPLDDMRDSWTLPLVPRALARGIPLLAICRGLQETNVALGGSLHQAVHELAGNQDHRADSTKPLDDQYGFAHSIRLSPGGRLAALLDAETIEVNSLHGQAVAKLGPGLQVEAQADDGVIEAFSMRSAPAFNLCVQWHPEWQAESNPVSMKILGAFGAACAARKEQKPLPET